MSEYEIIDLLQQRYSELGQLSALFFTLVSAYVVTAYLAGDKLSRVQLAIISIVYVIWVLANSMAAGNAISATSFYLSTLRDMGSSLPDSNTTALVTMSYLVLVQGGSIIASFYFMWTTRRKVLAKG